MCVYVCILCTGSIQLTWYQDIHVCVSCTQSRGDNTGSEHQVKLQHSVDKVETVSEGSSAKATSVHAVLLFRYRERRVNLPGLDHG